MLKGRLGLVTGAGGGGIGTATSKVLADQGATIVVTDINYDGCVEVVEELNQDNGDHLALKLDVSDPGSIKEAFEAVVAKYQRPPDHVIHCTCIGQNVASIIDILDDEMDRVYSTNLKGTMLMNKYAARWMIKHGLKNGSIVNISSFQGKIGFPGTSAYAATKAGQISITKTAALELGKLGIRVNCVCPGFVATPLAANVIPYYEKTATDAISVIIQEPRSEIIPAGRDATPKEVGQACAFLASDMASYITGTALDVTGGYSYANMDVEITGNPPRA